MGIEQNTSTEGEGVVDTSNTEQNTAAPENTDAALLENTQTPSIEDRAREQGWRPKDEYEGDPSKWVSAETFVAKGELIERIESLGKKLKDADKTIKMLTEHHQKVKESEFKRAVEYLKAQKKQAYEAGDVDKIIEIDEKIATVRETQKAQTAAEKEAVREEGPHPDFVAWVTDNKWYEKNSDMRADADLFGEAYARNNPDKSPQEVLEYVTKKIKRAYPDEFQNPNRNRPSSVEGGQRAGTSSGAGNSSFQLTEEETKIMNTFVRQGVLTKEQYIEEVKRMRGVK